MTSFLELNPEQREAIEVASHVMIIAGPGTDKTKTLVAKITATSASTRILAITFT